MFRPGPNPMTDTEARAWEMAAAIVNPLANQMADSVADALCGRVAEAVAPLIARAEAAERSWRCYHCDEVFTDDSTARDHFGLIADREPACRIKAGAERRLVHALREAEDAAAAAWEAVQNETADAVKAMYAANDRHRRSLIAAEEAGYERGLEDARLEWDGHDTDEKYHRLDRLRGDIAEAERGGE